MDPLDDHSAEIESSLRLSLVAGVGPRIRRDLLNHFGTAAKVLAATPGEWRQVPGIGQKLARALFEASSIDVAAELDLCRQHGIDLVTDEADDYPSMLQEIADPPAILFRQGTVLPADGIAVAIVGTRHATQYGLAQAERLAGELARAGICVISGLARGIDSAAHRGALDAGGRTIAVLGSGLLQLYPPENRRLAAEIAEHGAVLSELPPRVKPSQHTFPQRNRIVTGLSLGVIVVEAALGSGALISARHAMEQNREVFAVPGRVDSRASRGCHRLLRDGAKLVESVDDVLEELSPLVESTPQEDGRLVRHPAELQLNELERQVLDAVTTDPLPVDQVVANSGLPVHRVLATVSVLEMRRLVRRVSGNQIVRL